MGHKLKILKHIKKYKKDKCADIDDEPVSRRGRGRGGRPSKKNCKPGLFVGSYNEPVDSIKKEKLREAVNKYKHVSKGAVEVGGLGPNQRIGSVDSMTSVPQSNLPPPINQ